MSTPRGYVEFEDGTRWWAKPREAPCVCTEDKQCAYHAVYRANNSEADT